MKLKFKMLTLRQIVPQIRSEDWFVTIDLKDLTIVFPHIHPSVSQEVPEVCFWGQSIPVSGSSVRSSIITPHFHEMRRCNPGASSASGYSHYELHRRLVDSISVASVCSAASRCRAGPHERVGVTDKRQKSVLSPLQRTTFLGVV